MSTANTALRVTELDFFSIRNNLKNYLRSQTEFQDFDFEGSGMAVLLDILAYNTHYMAVQLNLTANEMFLDTAQMRSSILSLAKSINYVPSSKKGAIAKVDIIATPADSENQNTSVVTLQKYTRFLGVGIDGVNYPFVALYSNSAPKIDGRFEWNDLNLKQGEVITMQYQMTPDNETRRFRIPSQNVDTTSLIVTVQQSAANTYTEEYIPASDILDLRSNTAVYFVEENEDLTYTVYFGDGVIGKKPDVGSIITCTYIDTVGTFANNITRFTLTDAIGGLFRSNVQITTTSASNGGVEKESIEQIRYRAPFHYTSQNRAVTTLDYETLMLKDFNNIEAVSVWGGEDNDPVVYGKVFMTLKTKNNYRLTNLEKEHIKQHLIKSRNIVSITPEIVDPDYMYLLLRGKILYNPTLTSKTPQEILELVRAGIEDYTDNELNTFKSTFRKSKLQQYIESVDPSITASELYLFAQKRQEMDIVKKKGYDINFYVPLLKGNYSRRFFTMPEIYVLDVNGVPKPTYFEETPYSATGIDSVTVTNEGINYFSQPEVQIIGDGSGAELRAIVRNAKISKIEVLKKGTNYTKANLVITGGDGAGATAIARLEAQSGIIRSYYLTDNGDKVIINEDAGTIHYDEGKVILKPFWTPTGTPVNRYYDTDVATFNAPLDIEVIQPLRNRIVSIDINDPIAIQLDVIPE